MADKNANPTAQSTQDKVTPPASLDLKKSVAKADRVVNAQDRAPLKAIVASGGPTPRKEADASND